MCDISSVEYKHFHLKININKREKKPADLKSATHLKHIELVTEFEVNLISINNSNVKTVLLYGSESWNTTQEIVGKLRVFTHKCLHIILGIRWSQRVTNSEVCKICNQEDIMVSLAGRKWTWIGHVLRTDPSDIAKEGILWTPEVKRQQGSPKTTWRRSTEKELKSIHFTLSEIQRVT